MYRMDGCDECVLDGADCLFQEDNVAEQCKDNEDADD